MSNVEQDREHEETEYWESVVVDISRVRGDLASELRRTGDRDRFREILELCQFAEILERNVCKVFLDKKEVENV